MLRLPAEARREDGKVLRLAGDQLELVAPEWGLENWNWIEVKSGLTPEDKLVLQPGQPALAEALDKQQRVRARAEPGHQP